MYTNVNMFVHYSSQDERVEIKKPIDIEIRKKNFTIFENISPQMKFQKLK